MTGKREPASEAGQDRFRLDVGGGRRALIGTDRARDRQEGILSCQLPSILREMELEAGPAPVRDLIDAFEADACERIRIALFTAVRADRPTLRRPMLRIKCHFAANGSHRLADMFERIECGGEAMPRPF
jgi:hypothetical protein